VEERNRHAIAFVAAQITPLRRQPATNTAFLLD
jgi:hypothetical protein